MGLFENSACVFMDRWDDLAKERAQSGTVKTLPISLDFINLNILVFTVLPYWILMAALH